MSEAVGETKRGLERLVSGELSRRLVHASGSVIPALYLLELASWEQVTLLLVAGSLVAVVLEILRLFGDLDWRIYDHLTREYEQDNPAGYAYYMLSTTAVAVLFDPQIAIPSMLMLMIGDPLSGIAGSGEFRIVKRPVALVTMCLICLSLATPFLYDVPLAVALGGIAGTVADGVKPVIRTYVIDDNLTIPPAAAGAMWAGVELSRTLL